MPSDSATPKKRVVRMGKYEVFEHIATGGMGQVYRARDTEANQEVALKVLQPETAAKPALLERFRREARSAAKMRHENIVRVFEFGEIGGTYYLAMEFVKGVDLHDHIKRKGTLDPEDARGIVLQAARALRHAGEHNIVHRDIKPSNFLLTRKDGRLHVKLTDFGLAREVDGDEYRVTRAGTTVGTIDYMSPEQARDSSAADRRSDLYSLGVTWYQMLVGHVPFPKGGLGERLIKIINDPPPDARDLNPFVSDETWAILSKLLAKEPSRRYQEPSELIEDLLTLEGKATARPRARPAKRKRTGNGRAKSTDVAVPVSRASEGRKLKRIILAMCGGAAVILGVLIWWLTRPDPAAQADNTPAPAPIEKRPDDPGKKPADPKDKAKPVEKPAEKGPRWPLLYKGAGAVDTGALRKEVEAPFASRAAPEGAFVATVRRSAGGAAGTFATLEEALAVAPADRPAVLEVHDNGPLFATGLVSEGRAVTVRAGKGFRPLIVWDVPAALARRQREKKDNEPLVLMKVGGRLELSGLEIVCRWPGSLAEPGTLLDVSEGDLRVSDCTFSAVGRPRGGLTLARLRAAKGGARCRLTRVQARGGAMTALDLDAPAAEVLFDGCLVAGGAPALVRLKAALEATKLRVVRSTLVGGGALFEVRPAGKDGKATLHWLGWDALLCRAGPGDGDLLALRDGAAAGDVSWRAVNCVYAGWKNLLSGAATITAADAAGWRRQFSLLDGEEIVTAPWPAQAASEPGTEAAASYQPDRAVGYASTVDADSPLGADLKGLPVCRDGWAELLDLSPVVPDFLADASAPEVPEPGDGKYHGGKVDLTDTDLGAWLEEKQKDRLGPKVVLHLGGKGEKTTSPVRVKGATLVLYFEPPAEKEDKPLVLRLSSTKVAPLIEVTGGGLEVIGGTLKIPDAKAAKASYGLSVSGGDLRLYRTKLEGPQQTVPDGYEAAIRFVGAGERAERPALCLLNECVILSSRAGVVLDGPGARLGVRQSVVVAGEDGIRLLPGEGCKSAPSMQATLENVSFACRRSVVYLGDAPQVGVSAEPIVVRAMNCAYLNPFPARPKVARAGVLMHDAAALSRGLLVWRGEKEAFDERLHFGAWPVGAAMPAAKPGYGGWPAMWGTAGSKERRRDLVLLRELDPKGWALERLLVPMVEPPGANVRRLIDMSGKP